MATPLRRSHVLVFLKMNVRNFHLEELPLLPGLNPVPLSQEPKVLKDKEAFSSKPPI